MAHCGRRILTSNTVSNQLIIIIVNVIILLRFISLFQFLTFHSLFDTINMQLCGAKGMLFEIYGQMRVG